MTGALALVFALGGPAAATGEPGLAGLAPGEWQIQAGLGPAYHRGTELRILPPQTTPQLRSDLDLVPAWHVVGHAAVTPGLTVVLPAGLSWRWHRGPNVHASFGLFVGRFGHSYTDGALLELEAFVQGRFRVSPYAVLFTAYRLRPSWSIGNGDVIAVSQWASAAVAVDLSDRVRVVLSGAGGLATGMLRDEGAIWAFGGWGSDAGALLPFFSYRLDDRLGLFAAWEVAQQPANFGHTGARAIEIRTAFGIDWRFDLSPRSRRT